MTFSGSLSGRAVYVPPEKIKALWPHVASYLSAAVDHCGDWTIDQIADGLALDELQLWVAWGGDAVSAAAVTELETVPRGKVCRVVACGGSRRVSWSDCIQPIEEFAKAQGCVAVRVHGRPGWAKALPDYETEWVALEKRIDDARR